MRTVSRVKRPQSHTLKVVRSRLVQIADTRGPLSNTDLRAILTGWMVRDTDIPMIEAAGRIRKLRLRGAWADRDQAAFARQHTPEFLAKVEKYIKRMDRHNSNRV